MSKPQKFSQQYYAENASKDIVELPEFWMPSLLSLIAPPHPLIIGAQRGKESIPAQLSNSSFPLLTEKPGIPGGLGRL
ncbi:MAG: hypothetical protein K8T91_02930 [Planctomycetes bacterium]|nr:hypothetical protein [Planctomycetota bacterium]